MWRTFSMAVVASLALAACGQQPVTTDQPARALMASQGEEAHAHADGHATGSVDMAAMMTECERAHSSEGGTMPMMEGEMGRH